MNGVIFVGQGPGRDGDPLRPLEGHIAKRLGHLLGMPPDWFVHTCARINLNSEWIGKAGKGDIFDPSEGRSAAGVLLRGSWTRYVLLGKKVAECFNVNAEFLCVTEHHRQKQFFVLPHPSGINRWWNEPQNVRRAIVELRLFLL